MPLTEIRRKDVREWQRWMRQKDAADRRGPRKLADETIKRSQALLSAVLAHAVDRELREDNPCKGTPLKRKADESATRDKWAYLTIDEQRAIAACEAIPVWDRLAIRFAVATGLRQGEQFNLELADVVLDGPKPHVVIRYSWPKKGKKLPPKSGKTRTVPLSPEGVEIARACVNYLTGRENQHGLLFPSERGHRRHQGKPLGEGGQLRKNYLAAGIKLRPHLHWHALRHTCATNLVTGVLGRRWTLEEVRVVMGHSSIMITQRYAHLGDDVIAKAASETGGAVSLIDVEGAPPSNMNDTRSILAEGAQRVRSYVWRQLPKLRAFRTKLVTSITRVA